jgi:hypothetical protein
MTVSRRFGWRGSRSVGMIHRSAAAAMHLALEQPILPLAMSLGGARPSKRITDA